MNKKNFLYRLLIALFSIIIIIFLMTFLKIINQGAAPNTKNAVTASKGVLDSKIICLDPGHGKTSRKETEPIYPGSPEKKAANVSGASGKIMTEEELNLEVSLRLKQALEKEGATVFITRTTHECDLTNIERAEFANNSGCDILIRIHADGSESPSVSGISMLVPSKKRIAKGYLTAEIIEKSRIAGELILEKTTHKTGAKNLGIIERPDMTGFNWSSVPVILLEMGFITNAEEEENLTSIQYQDLLIEGIISGLDEYFKNAV